jgi:type IV pilus assembly protein PilB
VIQFTQRFNKKITLLDLLVEKNIITRADVDAIRHKSLPVARSIIEEVLEENFSREAEIIQVISQKFSIPVFDIEKITIDKATAEAIKYDWLKKYNFFPLFLDEGFLVIAMNDPTNIIARDDLAQITGFPVKALIASRSDIAALIDKYHRKAHLNDSLTQVVEFSDDNLEFDRTILDANYTEVNGERSPITNLVESIILSAIQQKVSDIHIEPLDSCIELRYRINGILKIMLKIPKKIQKHLISRIKILSDLDISECRRPQDGRVKMNLKDRKVDLRVSIIPTICGEKVVIRVLDAQEFKFTLESIGLTKEDYKILRACIRQPQGMVLVTGPTGSGKTSTLYSILNETKAPEINIVTIEDPVEYVINGINQIQVNEKIDVSFANGLRSILRQDPDVIFVGEIRDRETAEIAVRSSLTGHLVFSTLHTNSSIATIHRLKNIGIDTFLVASSILAVVAQRLIRLNCENCTHAYKPGKDLMKKFIQFFPDGVSRFHKGRGCEECHFTGYKSRMAIFEILPFKAEIKRLINEDASEEEILKAARKFGFQTLIEKAMELVKKGKTSLEEVERTCGHRDHADINDSAEQLPDYLEEINEFSKQTREVLSEAAEVTEITEEDKRF